MKSSYNAFAFAMLTVLGGCKPADRITNVQSLNASGSSMNHATQYRSFHYLFNPDYSRPSIFPIEISVDDANTFFTHANANGVGCGLMRWEGRDCGLCVRTYGRIQTPWLRDIVNADAHYAVDDDKEHLTGIGLADQTYRREQSDEPILRWINLHELHERLDRFVAKLSNGDSERRLRLLTELKNSLDDYDLSSLSDHQLTRTNIGLAECLRDEHDQVHAIAAELMLALDGVKNRGGTKR